MPLSDGGYIVSSKARIALFYTYLIAIAVLSFFVGRVVLENRSIAQQSHRALCTLKGEREDRAASSKAILDDPADPANAAIIRTFGKAIIIRSIHTARADVDALEDVSC